VGERVNGEQSEQSERQSEQPEERNAMSLHPMPNTSGKQITPIIVIDTREQAPLPITRFPTIRGTLISGDYSIAGLEDLFSVERKSTDDLCLSVTKERDRFERELHRLRGYRFKRLLVIGSVKEIQQGHYQSNVKPQSILASLSAFECRYDIPVVFDATPEQAGRRIESWAFWFSRDFLKVANEIMKHSGKG